MSLKFLKTCFGHSCDQHEGVISQEHSHYTNNCPKMYDKTTHYCIWYSQANLMDLKIMC